MAAIIQFRRDTAANWTSNNPTLAVGEFGYESDNERYKIGDGSTAWTSLAYGGLGDIPEYLIDAKGDLIVGTADNTPGILTVGTNGQMLVADSAAAGGVSWANQESIVNWHEAVKVATAAALPNTPSYDNGSSGVGATLTTATQVRLVVDGVNATTGDRVLVQDQATAAHNGIYDVTAQGASGSAVWLLTRTDDFDGTPTGQIKAGDAVYALAGSTNIGQGFTVTSTSDPHTVGTHDVDFTQFTGTQAFTAGTGVSITGNTINVGTASAARIVVNADDVDLATTGVSAAAYGSATQVPGYTVDAYGRLTAAANTTIAIPSTAVTDFTEAVQDVSGAQLATNGTHTGITAAYDDAGDGAIDLALVTENVQDITGAQLATNGSHTGITATYDDAGDGAVDLALITENVQDIVAGQLVTNGSHSGIAATYDDAGDGAIDLNVDDFTITLSGDIGGNVTVTNLGNATLATTIQADSVALGTDTTGNYLATLAGTANEVEVSGSGSETAAVTVGLPSAVTVTTSLTTPLVNISGASIVIEGATANDFETTLTVTDPTADRTITFADATGTVVTTGNLSAATEHIEDTVGAQLVTNGSHTHLTAAYDDAGDGAIDIALNTTAVTAAAYGSATAVPGYTVDAYGRLTAASNTTIAIPSTAVTDFTEAVQDVSGAQIATNGTHVGLTAAYDDAGDGAVDLTVAATLGTHTSGNYVATVAGTANEVEVSGSGSETAAVTVGLPSAVTVTTSLTTPLVNISGASIVIEGATANDFETTLTVTDPTADRTITFLDETGTVFTTASVQALANGVTATTQSASDNSTKLATTAYVDTGLGALSSDSITDADSDTKIQVEESADEDIIRFDTAGTERMTIAADGTVTIVGNLVVSGTETTISSTTITVDDKNIELGSVGSPDDTTADGGGITLKGATDKTWNWVNSTDAWTSSEHIDLASGKAFYVAGASVLNATTLGSAVVASSLTSVGTLTALTVSGIATFSGTIAGASPLVFEGATANDFETTFAITDPTADRTITFQDATGTVAYLASPTFTGTPAAPTAAGDTSTTQIATTAFVMTELGDYALLASPTFTGTPAAPTAAADTSTTQIATTAFVMTELGDYAPLASPTLTGVPAAPTAAADTNTTQIATTAYVQTELGALSSDSISDADSDTKIQVEESADEDKIRFDIAGTQVAVLDGTAMDIAGNVLYDIDIKEVNESSGTTYTFVLADRGQFLRVGDESNNTSANSITIPPNSSVAFPIGCQIQVACMGGEITMVAGSGVTLRYTPGLKLRAQFSTCTCIKIATDEWVLVGDLEA